MADTQREKVLAALTLAVSGEYGVPAPEDERDLPITIVEDLPDTTAQNEYGADTNEMPVVIARAEAATSRDGSALRAQANNALGNLVTAVFADETLGGLAEGISYTGGGIQTELGKFVFAEGQFTVTYTHVHGDPFTSI